MINYALLKVTIQSLVGKTDSRSSKPRIFYELQHKQAMMGLQEMAVLNGFNVAAWC